MKKTKDYTHSVNRLKNILQICDPESKGYDTLKRVSNNHLHDKNTTQERAEFLKQMELISKNTVLEYFTNLGKGESYEKNKNKINSALIELYSKVVDGRHKKVFGKKSEEPKITSYNDWNEFIKATLNDDIVIPRIKVLRNLSVKERDKMIKTIHVSDLPSGFKKHLDEYAQMLTYPMTIKSNNEFKEQTPDSVKKLNEDYMADKQQTLALHRLDYLAGLRILDIILDKFDIKLDESYSTMLSMAKVFESGISHVSIGTKKIAIFESPILETEHLLSTDSWAPTMRLHSVTKPAYESKSTGEIYCIHGVFLPKRIWKKTVEKKITVEEIMKIRNIEQRRVVIQHIGAEIFSEHEKAIKSKISPNGNQLIRLVGLLNHENTPDLNENDKLDVLMVKYKDPSTGREYHSFVPPTLDESDRESSPRTDPDEAMAWKFGMTKSDYYNKMRAQA